MVETLSRTLRIPVGIVMERRPGSTPWQDTVWQPVDVIPGAGPADGTWPLLINGDGWSRHHAATLDLELFHTDTDGYHVNLSQTPPRVWVALRPSGDDDRPQPFFATASAFEAEAYQVSGNDTVEPVPMPPALVALVAEFVAQHHVDRPFVKRERQPHGDDRRGGRRRERGE